MVIGAEPIGERNYRMIDNDGGDLVGGTMLLADEMKVGDAGAGRMAYIGVKAWGEVAG